MFHESFKGVLRMFHVCLKQVSRVFERILGVFRVSRKFPGYLEEVSRAFFKPKEARKFQGCFNEVSRTFPKSF